MLMLMMLFALGASAQNGIEVSGTVVDNNGESIIGATVKVKNSSSVGTVTDFDGNFRLKVPSQNSVLVISYIGMNTKEVKVGNKKSHRIILTEDNKLLNEVVVVGYGQQKKVSVVGSFTQTVV